MGVAFLFSAGRLTNRCAFAGFSFLLRFAARLIAQVAKLVDAPSSGGGARKGVLVRIRSWAQTFL